VEKIIYIIIGVATVIASYLFGRRKSDDGRTTVGQLESTVDGAVDILDTTEGVAGDIVQRSTESKVTIDDSVEQLDDIGDRLEDGSTELGNSIERNKRIQDIVSELRKRAESRENEDDTN